MKQDLKLLRKKCLEETKKNISESVNEDNLMIQAIHNIDELDKTCNSLISRLREWYSIYFPEAEHEISDNESLVRYILENSRKEIMEQRGIIVSMGAGLDKKDIDIICEYAEEIDNLYSLKENMEKYLDAVMERYCRNIKAVTGTTLGARLLAEAGSLKKMAMLPSTVIQLLGAEKALFRHLKTGAKPPRHGHIFAHPLVQGVSDKDRGKVSRALADKIALAARADYFKGEFSGDKLRKELEDRFG